MIFLMILNLEQLQQMVELNQHLNLVVKVNLMLIFFILNDFLFILIFYYLSFSYRYYHHPHLNHYHHYHCRLVNYLNLHYFINQIIHLISQVIFVDLNLYFNFNLCSSTITILFIIINKCYLSIFTNIYRYKDIQICIYLYLYIITVLLYIYNLLSTISSLMDLPTKPQKIVP